MTVYPADFPSVVFHTEHVCSTKHVHHKRVFLMEIRDDRQAAVAAPVDDDEGRENQERRAAEEPEEAENCEVDDVKILPVWMFLRLFYM